MNSKEMKELKELLDLLKERGVSEFELERGKQKIRIKRESASRVAAAPYIPPVTPAPVAAPPAEAAPPEPVAEPSSGEVFIVRSPMVGTFYRAPSPDGEPYVTPGDHVSPESAVCIIEAMKVFNEIRAEMSGTIVEVLAENSEAVEYNQPLFLIKPD